MKNSLRDGFIKTAVMKRGDILRFEGYQVASFD